MFCLLFFFVILWRWVLVGIFFKLVKILIRIMVWKVDEIWEWIEL